MARDKARGCDLVRTFRYFSPVGFDGISATFMRKC